MTISVCTGNSSRVKMGSLAIHLNLAKNKLAILSYHGWEIKPNLLADDIRQMRDQGWQALNLESSLEFVQGRSRMTGNYFLMTSDDETAKNKTFIMTLRSQRCPGAVFVNVGNLDMDDIMYLRELAQSDDIGVEDHGWYHRRHFTSGAIYQFRSPGSYVGGLEHLKILPGMPIFMTGSEVASRKFVPDPKAIQILGGIAPEFCQNNYQASSWNKRVESALLPKKLAFRRRGHLCVAGRVEDKTVYIQRVAQYITEGKRAFEKAFLRSPECFAYTWWQGNQEVDRILRSLGYRASFAGLGRFKRSDKKTYGIPRIAIDNKTPRPLNIKKLVQTC